MDESGRRPRTHGSRLDATIKVRTRVNEVDHERRVHPAESAAEFLREGLGLTGTKVACGQGACGACTVLVDGTPLVSCLLPATSLQDRSVRTIEGLHDDGLHPVQKAFMAEDALQCGYCTPGFVLEAVHLYDHWRSEPRQGAPSRDTIADALAGHMCRCGAYGRIFEAVRRACAGDFEDGPEEAPRIDGPDKVRGAARYTVDIQSEHQLEGAILRSPHAHARILEIDDSTARRMDGVRAVVELTNGARELRYAGQEIVAVAAVSGRVARAALRAIKVDYEVLPAVTGMAAALEADAPTVYPPKLFRRGLPNANEGPLVPSLWSGNQRGPFPWFSTVRRAGRALRRARQNDDWTHVRGQWRTHVQCHSALEPHACVAHWVDADRLVVHASTQAVRRLRNDIAERWSLDPEHVRVLASHVGGGFGAKAELSPEIVAAIELARAADAPVRVALDRREELTVGGNRPEQTLDLELGVDPSGSLAGVRLRARGNAGVAVGNVTSGQVRFAYPGVAKDLIDWDVTTHAPPGKPFRGPGGPPALWALEQAVDEVAIRRREDPIQLRRRWDTDPVRHALYDWAERLDVWRQRDTGRGGKGRYRAGVGIATGVWPCFVEPAARVRIDLTLEGIVVSTASQDIGNGTRSVLADAVAARMFLPRRFVRVEIGDSDLPQGPMAAGSRTVSSLVPTAESAAEKLVEQLLEVASRRLELSAPAATAEGLAHDGGCMPWTEVLQRCAPLVSEARRRRDPQGYFLPMTLDDLNASKNLAASVQVSEVEVDTWLGRVRVTRTWTGIGSGRIVSPVLARSQVEGGVVQGIGYALYEERHLDGGTGVNLSASLDDYHLPGIGDTPEMAVHFHQDGYAGVAGRSVGIGELATLAVAASIGNAVHHATGWRPYEIPMHPRRVVEAMAR